MKFGYARVSTELQQVDSQIQKLLDSGVSRENIFIDSLSGKDVKRPSFDMLMNKLREGDVIFITRLDRLSRSLPQLVSTMEILKNTKVGLVAIEQGTINTTTSTGELLFGVLSVIASFESSLRKERVKEGILRIKNNPELRKTKYKGRFAYVAPEKYKIICDGVQEGRSVRSLVKETGCCFKYIAKIRDQIKSPMISTKNA